MSRKDEAYQYIKKRIITFELRPSDPVPEMEIAEAMQMSRTPIREALRDLENDGLVISYPARGCFVTSLTATDVENIYELRRLLETWALRKSIHRITAQECDELSELFQIAHKEQDWEKTHTADRRLHGMIVERARCNQLNSFIRTLETQNERIRQLSARNKDRDKSLEEHLLILKEIRSQNAEAAEKALDAHLRSVIETAIESVTHELY